MDTSTDPAEYDIRQEGSGWAVYNTRTGEPVRLNDAAQVNLTREVAEEIVETLQVFQPGPAMDGEA
jgi:hypothetical protein